MILKNRKFKKRNSREVADSILLDGEIVELHKRRFSQYVIVKAFGHLYKIENHQGVHPRITQLDLTPPKGD